MTFDLAKIIESKRAYRKKLAELPIAEKLRMLDALRECTLDIRKAMEARTRKGGRGPGAR